MNEQASVSQDVLGSVYAHSHSLLLLLLLLCQKDAYSANALQMLQVLLLVGYGRVLYFSNYPNPNKCANPKRTRRRRVREGVPGRDGAGDGVWRVLGHVRVRGRRAQLQPGRAPPAHRQLVRPHRRHGLRLRLHHEGCARALPLPGFMHGAQRRDRPLQRQSLNRNACVQLVMCVTCKGSSALSCRSGTGPNSWRHARRCMRQALSNPYSSIEHHCTESIGVSPV